VREQLQQLAEPIFDATNSCVCYTVQHGDLRVLPVVKVKHSVQKREHALQARVLQRIHASFAERDPRIGFTAHFQGKLDEAPVNFLRRGCALSWGHAMQQGWAPHFTSTYSMAGSTNEL
jgi:hypothetical protein